MAELVARRARERERLAVEQADDRAAALQRETLADEEHLLVEDRLQQQAAHQRGAVGRADAPRRGGVLHERGEEGLQQQRLREHRRVRREAAQRLREEEPAARRKEERSHPLGVRPTAAPRHRDIGQVVLRPERLERGVVELLVVAAPQQREDPCKREH